MLFQIHKVESFIMTSKSKRFMRVGSSGDGDILFKTVPEDKEFFIQLMSSCNEELDCFSYVLKKGKELPYSVNLLGELLLYSHDFAGVFQVTPLCFPVTLVFPLKDLISLAKMRMFKCLQLHRHPM